MIRQVSNFQRVLVYIHNTTLITEEKLVTTEILLVVIELTALFEYAISIGPLSKMHETAIRIERKLES